MSLSSNRDKLRAEYGSIKAAFTYCLEMNMCKAEAKRFLEVNNTFLQQWTNRLNIKWPMGDRHSPLARELSSERMTEMNRARRGEKRPPYFKQMKPIEKNGVVWYPGEPTFHFLRSRK